MERDSADHVRFCPLQSALGQELCRDHGVSIDLSTAVLLDGGGVHTQSAAVLRLFPWMGFPWSIVGRTGLLVPAFIRDAAYGAFARNRGAIWKVIKRITGLGDTRMEEYRDRILGLEDEEPLDPNWGFDEQQQLPGADDDDRRR